MGVFISKNMTNNFLLDEDLRSLSTDPKYTGYSSNDVLVETVRRMLEQNNYTLTPKENIVKEKTNFLHPKKDDRYLSEYKSISSFMWQLCF